MNDVSAHERAPDQAGAQRVAAWPILLLALPAFVAIWSGWVGIGELAGFGVVNLLPGILPDGGAATINTAITLPIGVETYAAYALRVWLSPVVPARARLFAGLSAGGSLVLGAIAQVAYHLMVSAGVERAPVVVVVVLSCTPLAVLGAGVALVHLLRAGYHAERAPAVATPPVSPMASARQEDTHTHTLIEWPAAGAATLVEREATEWRDGMRSPLVPERRPEPATSPWDVPPDASSAAVWAQEAAEPLIIAALRAGERLTGKTISERYSRSEATGRRWLADAKAKIDPPLNGNTPTLTLVPNGGERS